MRLLRGLSIDLPLAIAPAIAAVTPAAVAIASPVLEARAVVRLWPRCAARSRATVATITALESVSSIAAVRTFATFAAIPIGHPLRDQCTGVGGGDGER